jgi:hypothetical protein
MNSDTTNINLSFIILLIQNVFYEKMHISQNTN